MSLGTHLFCPRCRAIFATEFECCPADGFPLEHGTVDPNVGVPFADRYVIEAFVDEGASARVYRARHAKVSRRFAIKVLLGEHASDGFMRGRFFREAEVACTLRHENLVSVVDVGETSRGVPYLVMDWIEGRNLLDVIRGEGPMPRPRVLAILRQMARGLAHAHGRGLVHRDFKPGNVLVTENGGCKIVDFGLAVPEQRDDQRLTGIGVAVGTPAYMAPEQVLGRDVDSRCDQFALGVILYEMLSCRSPFSAEGAEVARLNLSATPPSIAERAPGLTVDPDLEAIAHRLMAKDPADRFPDTASLVDHLEALDDVSPGDVSCTHPMPRTPRRARVLTAKRAAAPSRWPRLLGPLAVGIAAAGAAAFFALGASSLMAPAPGPSLALVSEAEALTIRRDHAALQPNITDSTRLPEPSPARGRVDPLAEEGPSATEAAATSARGLPAASSTSRRGRTEKATRRALEPTGGERDAVADGVAESPPVATPDPSVDDDAAARDDFAARYREIGGRLAELGDDARRRRLTESFLAIPYQDALRKPALRVQARRVLAQIAGDLAR